jgi:type I restriction enzyme S subunit
MNETLEAMAQAMFKSWFVDFDPVMDNALAAGNEIPEELQEKAGVRKSLGDKRKALPEEISRLFPSEFEYSEEMGWIPKGWEVTKLKEGIQLYDNQRIPLNKRQRFEKKGNIPYYGAAGIVDYINDYIFEGIYVLVGEDGTVQTDDGKPVVQYVWGQFWVNNHAHICLGKNDISTEHLYLLLKEINITPFITGAVQPKLNQQNLYSVPIVFANFNVNKCFKNKIFNIFQKIIANSENISQLIELRDTLLPKLLSGQLRIPNAEKLAEAVL